MQARLLIDEKLTAVEDESLCDPYTENTKDIFISFPSYCNIFKELFLDDINILTKGIKAKDTETEETKMEEFRGWQRLPNHHSTS